MLCLNRTKAGTRTRIKALGAAEPECFSLCAHKISTQTHLAMQDNKNIPLWQRPFSKPFHPFWIGIWGYYFYPHCVTSLNRCKWPHIVHLSVTGWHRIWLEAVCPSAVGQDQLFSVSSMVDLMCFLISPEQGPSLFSKTCRDKELGRQPLPRFPIDSTGKHFQCLI